MLVFDPDTTLASLEKNLAFMERHADAPLNFGRVELYAGTPLLRRMQAEGRVPGDYLGWDYSLRDAAIERVFESAMRCFYDRNFATGALANRLMGTRFDVEVARFFHPELYRPAWIGAFEIPQPRARHGLRRGLREIVSFVSEGRTGSDGQDFEWDLCSRLRAVEDQLAGAAAALEDEVRRLWERDTCSRAPCRWARRRGYPPREGGCDG